ncbi:ABC transporter ATP-binding protein [Rhodoluna sp.]|uniref:ABC transporter ATP-binding protein n=1 Tax=Rhodoluna sp. TaxID=1969481 RepID=UPI0025E66B48|nr:ABC transporter ATP-binding protein [Rhodoluna sp.]
MHGGGPMGRFSTDPEQIRARNASAPKIENLLKRIFQLFAPYKRPLIGTAVLVFLSAALSVIPPLLIQGAFNNALFPSSGTPELNLLMVFVLSMIGIWLLAAVLGVWQTYLTSNVGNKVMGSLRVRMFAHLQAMELAFFTKTKTGAIQSRLQNDVGGVAGVLSNTMSSILGSTVTVLASFVAMLLLSWQLTLVAVVMLPLMVLLQRKVGQVRAKIASKTQESLSEMSSITQESLGVSGILLAKSFGRQASEISRYETENKNQIGLQVRQTMSGQTFFALVQVFMSSIPAIIYLCAGYLILNVEPITVGTVVAFTTAQARLLFPMMNLMQISLDLQTSQALFARIFEYFDLKPSITNKKETKAINQALLGTLEFENVTFAYPETEGATEPTLKNVSFKVEVGQYVAIVGASGSGKTTISYLIPRFYDVTGGVVKFTGTDVRELNQEELIQKIGIVNQETYLFYDTIRENLAYAKPSASQAEIENAAKAANIHDVIMSFPKGYETMVGERGYRLSGGEKQRIAIARVLLKDPPVIILDEATSAMDTNSERIVQATLDAATANRTTIAIAHRLSTVANADIILVLDKGEIVERGTHPELLAANGAYARLVKSQNTFAE